MSGAGGRGTGAARLRAPLQLVFKLNPVQVDCMVPLKSRKLKIVWLFRHNLQASPAARPTAASTPTSPRPAAPPRRRRSEGRGTTTLQTKP